MKRSFLLLFAMIITSGIALAQNTDRISIIPKPSAMTVLPGAFKFSGETVFYVDEKQKETRAVAVFFAKYLETATGIHFKIEGFNDQIPNKGVVFVSGINNGNLGEEGYTLKADKNCLKIEANTSKGIFYATQTIRQLLPPEIENNSLQKKVKSEIPLVNITDSPRFNWRGFMLDVSRTFYSVDVVKKYLDLMALFKLNVFHLHLTDDQGWRIEIKKYPLLTDKKSTVFDSKFGEPAERSGYYTQEQLKDLVAYAQARNITIVPEIDLPGHTWAAIIAYPEYGSNQKLDPPYVFPFLASWGIWGNQFTPNILDPTNDRLYTFLDDIFSEILEIFPSKYIHFGGDEVRHKIWESEPHIKEFMTKNGMKNGKDLQTYFVARIIEMLKAKGRIPMGWNDILEGDKEKLKGTTIMAWLGENAIKEAAENKIHAVATPTDNLYFDITQANRNDGTLSDLAYPNINSLDLVYNYNPTEGLNAEESKYVMGEQANMWPALAREVKDVNIQLFPRLIALAEASWIKLQDKNFDNFKNRLSVTELRLDKLHVDYYKDGGFISGKWEPKDLTTDFKDHEWDVTPKIYTNGRVYVGFYYTKGANYLDIERVDLLENGKIISSDEHPGLADTFRGTHKTKTFQYHLKVDSFRKGAKYVVRARIRGHQGTDSYGNFTFNQCPYEPFSVTEPK